MRYAGEKMAGAFLAQQAPVRYGRLRFASETDARIVLESCKRLRTFTLPGRVRRIQELSYVSSVRLDYCYGWVSCKEGMALVFLPSELACFFDRSDAA